jgi:hypothetical protein
MIPYGYCHCGCGEKTKISPWNVKRYGFIAGQPRQFLRGHHNSTFPVFNDFSKRFWSKVDIKGIDECWPFKNNKSNKYGRIYYPKIKKYESAHRIAWELTNGPIPEGFDILHKCDFPPCNNPNHLFPGTQKDNMNDMYSKGRGNAKRGSLNYGAKVTEMDVVKIRQLREQGLMLKEIADIYDLAITTTCNIIHKQTWKHVL